MISSDYLTMGLVIYFAQKVASPSPKGLVTSLTP